MPRLTKRTRRAATVIGVVLAVAVASIAYWEHGKAQTRAVCAYFDNTFGLYPGAAVTIRGIKVGTVNALDPQGARVRVAMTIDHRRLPADVGAAVMNSSILTDRRVELLGTSYQGGAELAAGQCIAQDRTKVPVSVSDALNSFAHLVRQLTTADPNGTSPLQALLVGADRELDGIGPTLNRELRDLITLTEAPDSFMNKLGQLLDNSAELSTFVTSEWDEIKTTLTTFGPGLEVIENLLQVVKVVVGKLADAIDPMNRLFTDHFPYLMEVLNSTVPVVTLIRTRTEDSKDLLDRIPGIILMLRTMIDTQPGAITLGYRPPAVQITDPAALCTQINSVDPRLCDGLATSSPTTPLPQLLLSILGGPR